MNKGSKYKSGQRPTFRIWDNEKNDWFEPTYEGWDGKIEELLLSPTGDLTMRTFTDFKHESVFPERFEIVLDEPQKISWRKAISVLEHHFQCEIPRNLDNVVKGYREMSGILNTVEFELSKRNSELTAKEFIFEALESNKQKVKVPAFVAEWYEEHKHNLSESLWEFTVELNEKTKVMGAVYTEFESWFIDHPRAYEFITSMKNGYEVEEEPKWVVKVGNLYFCGWEDTTAQFVMNTVLGEDESIIKYKNEGTASSVAKNLGGTVEKV